ncbi:MAG: hypothetical protein ACYSYW_08190 [Planctomycetota bacterium]|jgi:hypothetical protein
MKEDKMFVLNSNSSCEQARPYYYEYICEETKINIPSNIATHIQQCNNCQIEVERLKSILLETQNQSDESFKESNFSRITNANLHFSHIGESVSCKTARPFLPSLADPLLKIGIPTPITTHLDKCNQCECDLQKIIELNLTHKQLCRLGQIFAEMPYESPICCTEVEESISKVVSMAVEDLSEDIFKHVCTCPDCRSRVYQERQEHIQTITSKESPNGFSCKDVKNVDIFDYCFPYGINPKTNEDTKFSSFFLSHIINCSKCLNKMQDLHIAINDIIERDESGIYTCYKVIDKTEAAIKETDPDENIYDEWPIKVEVTESSIKPVVYQSGTATDTKKSSGNKILPIFKYASVAAAILILATIFISTPTAKAINLREVYNALGQIRNVYITAFDEKTSETSQEVWVSHDLNIKMFKSNAQIVLWDLNSQVHRTADLNKHLVETTELNMSDVSKIKDTMEAPCDLLPFKSTTALPENAKWQKIPSEKTETLDSNSEVYDLIWEEKSFTGFDVSKKCRVYLDVLTNLPYKTQWFENRNQEDKYELLTTINVSYLSTDEVSAIIRQNGLE